MNKQVLITGGAGFVGYHVTRSFLEDNDTDITVIDNFNPYYSVDLKEARIQELFKLHGKDSFNVVRGDIADKTFVEEIFKRKFDVVVHLAAQAGVRYAKENPRVYLESNVDGFFNVINSMQKSNNDGLLLYASSSSVYGGNKKVPFEETDTCTNPLSIYASSKLADEMIAESYVNSFGMKCIGLRFFNVYGPWGRPDAAYYKWSQALKDGEPIELRDNGELYRDMTYAGDVVKSIRHLIDTYSAYHSPIHEVFNIGNESPVRIGDLLDYLVKSLGIQPVQIQAPPRGNEEPVMTRASTDKLKQTIGFAPATPFQKGIDEFIAWFKQYHKNSN